MHLTTPQLKNALESIIATHENAFARYKNDVAQRYDEELQKNQMQALEQLKELVSTVEKHGGINELIAWANRVKTQPELFS